MRPSLSGKPLIANLPWLCRNWSRSRSMCACIRTDVDSKLPTRSFYLRPPSYPVKMPHRKTCNVQLVRCSARHTFSLKKSESNVLLSESL
jgi:hypothetical protein